MKFLCSMAKARKRVHSVYLSILCVRGYSRDAFTGSYGTWTSYMIVQPLNRTGSKSQQILLKLGDATWDPKRRNELVEGRYRATTMRLENPKSNSISSAERNFIHNVNSYHTCGSRGPQTIRWCECFRGSRQHVWAAAMTSWHSTVRLCHRIYSGAAWGPHLQPGVHRRRSGEINNVNTDLAEEPDFGAVLVRLHARSRLDVSHINVRAQRSQLPVIPILSVE